MGSLLQDIEEHPDLFDIAHPVISDEIERIEAELGAELPPSSREILERHGQGTFFDNESLLGVHQPDEGLGELLGVNQELRIVQNMPDHFLVFHLGTGGLHAFDLRTRGPEYGVIALDEETLEPGESFDNLETWYREHIRRVYAEVLGLS